ncbi:MAG: hypothetical protein CYG60_21210 [Actinobacteria bacterium]|nr:MAG: hypothetical protein CYG60_21210 [Actinomycetota bacterium]
MDHIGARGQDHHGHDTYSASEAAEVLGLGKRRVLQMLERRELVGSKDEAGRWTIPAHHVHELLVQRRERDQDHRKRTPEQSPEPEATSELVESLRDEIEFLRDELHRREDRHAEEIRRRDHLLAAALERIPELETPRDKRGSPDTPADEPQGTQAPEPHPTPQKSMRRPWWRRVFGG